MGRAAHTLSMLGLCLALATTTAVATAVPTAPATISDQEGQRKALYQSELEQNLLLRTHLGYGFLAAHGLCGRSPAGSCPALAISR
jgi:hypothetical protein